jgi:hypothetical protein
VERVGTDPRQRRCPVVGRRVKATERPHLIIDRYHCLVLLVARMLLVAGGEGERFQLLASRPHDSHLSILCFKDIYFAFSSQHSFVNVKNSIYTVCFKAEDFN